MPRRTLVRLFAIAILLVLCLPGAAVAQDDATEEEALGWQERFDGWFGETVVAPLNRVLFFSIYSTEIELESGDTKESELPLIVVVLVLGGLFYTIRYGFLNVRLFGHAISVLRGRYDDPNAKGEVSHFKALTAALSATVGLGNISGVAVAITVGGPGAVFWMWITAFFGMSMKFSSCVCAQLYRQIHEDGRVLGGPMVYLEQGFKEKIPSLAFVGKGFAILFAVLTVFSAFGAGNMFQVNQTVAIVVNTFFDGSDSSLLRLGLGAAIAVLTGFVIIGGIKRIGEVTAKLVPAMCLFYCGVCLIIIVMNLAEVPSMFAGIFSNAFQAEAMFGGFVGVLVQGMRRAAFSNEAGLGSASIAQAAAKTVEPVQAGAVAMLGPFIDTMVVCTMTALAILITGSHIGVEGLGGVEVTAQAFAALGPAVPYVLCAAVFIFAYSTLISWGYYGERAVEYLFGPRGVRPYRIVYVLTVVIGPLLSLGSVLDFADALLLSMAFPNIIGMLVLSGTVKGLVVDYTARLKSGAIHRADA
jgi:AGCS family alanine or glycine:cation symporter